MEASHKQASQKRKTWLKLARNRSVNQKKVKRFAMYKKNQVAKTLPHKSKYFSTISKTFDWRKKGTTTSDKENAHRTELEESKHENFRGKYEGRRLFRKGKRPRTEHFSCDEMWTLSARKTYTGSLCVDEDATFESDKIFWRTSKMSLPVTMNEKSSRGKLQNRKMLWRSLRHVQRLYEENYLNEVLDIEFRNASNNPGSRSLNNRFATKNAISGRKARLSRWNFLRYVNNNHGVPCESPKMTGKKYSKLFAGKRTYSKSEGHASFRGSLEDLESFYSSEESCDCSCCSCEKCVNDLTGYSQQSSADCESKDKMAPNSEEDQMAFQNRRSWGTEYAEKEPLRPPVYNPEDYAISLKKWGKKTNSGMQLPLYLSQSTGSIDTISAELNIQDKRQSSPSMKSSSSIKNGDEPKQSKKERDFTLKVEKKDLKNKENIHRGLKNELSIDFRNPILALSTQEGEMSLRQFSSVTELLEKLKVDLKLSFPSFVQEFVGDPVDGVTLLLELLRAVQLSQASQQQKRPPQILRRALLDEHSCLICLKHCLRCSDATRRLVSSTAGLFTLAVCIMSNVTQSRIIALELLTRACEIPTNGHKAVSEALSTLRLRFGEPVRFRFLVGMLNSVGTIELLATAMKFINVFVETAPSIQQKVYIQAELEQAGFDAKTLRKTLPCNSESVKSELNKWEKIYFDVENLQNRVVEVDSLQEKIQLLEKRIQILQEEKGILQSLEQCLKERCSELEEEVSIKTSTTKTPSTKPFHAYETSQNKRNTEKGESTPAEDEGISSSEQELSQDEDYVKEAIAYNNSSDFGQTLNSTDSLTNEINKSSKRNIVSKVSGTCDSKNYKNFRSREMKETNVDDGNEIVRAEREKSEEEEETTIDEVIEELENIVNDAETQAYASEESKKLNEKLKQAMLSKRENNPEEKGKRLEKPVDFEETEIVPSLIHPQPPRKGKNLVHIYLPRRDFDSHEHPKREFFDEDTDTESSDSLLTATREKRSMNKSGHNRSLGVTDSFNSFSSSNTRTLFIRQEEDYEESEVNLKIGYEERNIDEEEIKRRHLKNSLNFKGEKAPVENFSSPIFFRDNKRPIQRDFIGDRLMRGSMDRLNENAVQQQRMHEKTTPFQSFAGEKLFKENSFSQSPQKYAPTPVKRSQTFHLASSNGDGLYKRAELVKPKPKMGVSGLDFQRSTDTQKPKNELIRHQSNEYKKWVEQKNDQRRKEDEQRIRVSYDDTSNGFQLCRRGSFDGTYQLINVTVDRSTRNAKNERSNFANATNDTPFPVVREKPCAKVRSKSLEKMDEGLDSLVDIVIANNESRKTKLNAELHVEVSKNIGPRTRRSLAESSLFSPPCGRSSSVTNESSPKPPKPAQRTSLNRQNSSSTPLHLPREIKLAPYEPPSPGQQTVYSFGIKSVKSEDSLFSSARRCPPDGASNPNDYKTGNCENRKPRHEEPPFHLSQTKGQKLQQFFYNTKPESRTASDTNSSKNSFEDNYRDKPVSPKPRNVQSRSETPEQKIFPQKQSTDDCKPLLPKSSKSSPSKPNFLLGTYQSPATANNIPKPSSSVLSSINTFNNTFGAKKLNAASKSFAPGRTSTSGGKGSSQTDRSSADSRQINPGNSLTSEKLTDSPSGLY